MSTQAPTLPTVDQLRAFINTVRPHKGADLIESTTSEPVPGLTMRVELHRGRASSGYHSDFEKVETWWVVNYVTRHDLPGRRFVRGRRYSGKSPEAKARRDYAEAVQAAKGGT
jgi:hypothetical protein